MMWFSYIVEYAFGSRVRGEDGMETTSVPPFTASPSEEPTAIPEASVWSVDLASGDTALEEAAAVSAVEPAAVVEDVCEPPHPAREDAAITAAAASAISRLFFINESLLSLFFTNDPGGEFSSTGGYPAVASGDPDKKRKAHFL